jgi:DNA-binding NarL/FixJ family response regulator
MSKLRVLLADDHEMLLERVRSILSKDFEVVGTVGKDEKPWQKCVGSIPTS